MDLVRLKHMGDYWRENPPVHMMVAAYLGVKKDGDSDAPSAQPVEDTTGALLDLLDPAQRVQPAPEA